jgi:dynein heavy chain
MKLLMFEVCNAKLDFDNNQPFNQFACRYVTGIRAEVERLEGQLKHFGKVLDQWCECQKQWMYLESIFSAPDIQRQLPNESKAFFAVDKQFKDIMKRTHDR